MSARLRTRSFADTGMCSSSAEAVLPVQKHCVPYNRGHSHNPDGSKVGGVPLGTACIRTNSTYQSAQGGQIHCYSPYFVTWVLMTSHESGLPEQCDVLGLVHGHAVHNETFPTLLPGLLLQVTDHYSQWYTKNSAKGSFSLCAKLSQHFLQTNSKCQSLLEYKHSQPASCCMNDQATDWTDAANNTHQCCQALHQYPASCTT